MSLAPGSRLGPYEVIAPLGSGGMGEVYRAHDTRLGRPVALKVMSRAFSTDRGRLLRLEQEARATAALNHPHILTVYDIGEHSGQPYVVSELLEGRTLRDELAQGSVSTKKAIDWATQVCDGLAVAHERGIVHRDLKPENLFVTREGRIKILDFGLAKLIDPEDAISITRTGALGTIPGIVLGTAGYMAPEQVRGLPIDRRADIFSLGVVIYEMLAGRSAFQGPSAIEVMNAILKDDPAELPDGVPATLASIVHRCLEKNAELRFQSARDLAFALSMSSGTSLRSVPAPTQSRPVRRWQWLTIAVAMMLCTGLGAWIGTRFPSRAANPPIFRALTFQRGFVSGARFAPDGHTVAYSATWMGDASDIYSMRIETPDARPLGLIGAHLFAISSTGEMAVGLDAFLGAVPGMVPRATLARVPLAGGAPRVVLTNVEDADWDPKGENIAVAHVVNGVSRLEYPIGKVLYQSDGWMDSIRLSPDGTRIAFGEHPMRGDDRGFVAMIDMAGKKTVLATRMEMLDGVAWAPGGAGLYFCGRSDDSQDTLWSVALSGAPRAVLRSPLPCFLRDITAEGKILLDSFTSRNEMIWREEGTAPVERSLTWLTDSFPADLTADGKMLLFTEPGMGSNYQVCLRKTDGSPVVRLGEGEAEALSADGKWVLTLLLTTPPQLMLIPTGAGDTVRLPLAGLDYKRFAQWFPGSKQILFAASESGRATRLWMQNVFPPGAPQPITGVGVTMRGKSIAPDGKTVAAVGPDGQLTLYPVAGAAARAIPATEIGDQFIRWSRDGKQVFTYGANRMPVVLYRTDVVTGVKERLREFRPADAAGATFMYHILLTDDTNAGVYSFQRTESHLKLMEWAR